MDYIWNITGRCNFTCTYCWDIFKKDPDVDFEAAKKIVDDLVEQHCTQLIFTGGEPMVRKDFFQIVEYAWNKGIKQLKLCTNGFFIPSKYEEILRSPLNEIHVSIDDIEQAGNAQRGKNDRVIQGIESLVDIRKVKRDLKIVLVTVINPYNLGSFRNVLEYSRDRGVNVTYQFPVEEEFTKPLRFGLKHMEMDRLRNLFAEVKQLHGQFKDTLDFFARFYFEAAQKYYLHGQPQTDCPAGKLFNIVSPSGEIYPCYEKVNHSQCADGCSEKCLIWFRSPNRARKILALIH